MAEVKPPKPQKERGPAHELFNKLLEEHGLVVEIGPVSVKNVDGGSVLVSPPDRVVASYKK